MIFQQFVFKLCYLTNLKEKRADFLINWAWSRALSNWSKYGGAKAWCS